MEQIIKAEHIVFRYPADTDENQKPAENPPILKDISLEIAKGSYCHTRPQRKRKIYLRKAYQRDFSPRIRKNVCRKSRYFR